MTLFEELKGKIHSEKNCNFHLLCLDLTTQVWIQELCDLINEKLVENVCSCESKDTVNYGKFDQCLDCGLPKH